MASRASARRRRASTRRSRATARSPTRTSRRAAGHSDGGPRNGPPNPPNVRGAPGDPWRSSTIHSAQELADLAEGFGVRAAEELEDDGLRRGDHGARLTRLRQAEIHARRAPRADRVGHDRDADAAAEQ